MAKRTLSSLGSVTKKELLTVVNHIEGNSIMVFETQHPYSGYYGTTVPDGTDAWSYFLVTKLKHNDDKIIRAIQSVKKSTGLRFDAVPGQVSFNNRQLGVIRLKCISESNITGIAEAFKKAGIDFMQTQKQAPVDALIHITKYFDTEEVEDGIFLDLNNDSFAYIRLDQHLEWKKFESVRRHVRNNVGGITFDAALTTLYDKCGIIDLVRIYDDTRSIEKLRTIRNRYLDSV